MSWTMTIYPHARSAQRGRRLTMSRVELARKMACASPHDGPKDTLQLLCPATFKNDHRGNDRVEAVHMLGLDIDEPQADPAACVATLARALGGVELFAYSTASSLPGAYRMRALIPYDRCASGDEHRASWSLVARVLARAGVNVDRACSDPARGFYVWAVPRSGAYYSAHLDGAPWPVGRAAEVEARRAAAEAVGRQPGGRHRAERRGVAGASVLERARRYVERMPPAIAGAGGHSATFAVARKLVADFGLTDAEAWPILVEYNTRCQPTWSERELRHKLADAARARVRVPMRNR